VGGRPSFNLDLTVALLEVALERILTGMMRSRGLMSSHAWTATIARPLFSAVLKASVS
jgi:hypothetical protein